MPREILDLYARLLDYPGRETAGTLQSCRDRLAAHPKAEGLLDPLARCLEEGSGAALEELYTASFDLQPRCSPYVGFQLCGESRERTLFLLKLREIYRSRGFDEGEGELPDHLAVMLRFLARLGDPGEREEIVRDGLLPALARMTSGFDGEPQHPYGALLASLQAFLGEACAGADAGCEEVASCST